MSWSALLAALAISTGAAVEPTAAPVVLEPGAVFATVADGRAPKVELAPALRDAQAAIANKDWAGAARLLLDHLARASGDGAIHDTLAQALEKLERADEAAHHYAFAARLYLREGKEPLARASSTNARRVDPLAPRRESFQKKLVGDLHNAAQELQEQGHAQRAIDLLERVEPLADGKEAAALRALLEKARAAFQQVDLDQSTRAKPASGEWPMVERESPNYRFRCQLEPEIVDLVSGVMDDIHAYYVQVYFDGDAKRAKAEKATIRVHPTRAKMLETWQGGAPPEGWWSPGTNEVIAYDTRTSSGSLDELLLTLFHEASHQFMTLSSGGGFVPAWINEGTATFFEGTRAMADHKVIWPDAAIGRLNALVYELDSGKPPTARDVVAYSSPGSYAVEYYAYGWGLVYFLLEYEAADTLEHVYRPLYAEYKRQIVKRGPDGSGPLGLFEETMLGKSSPLGHARFDDFERDWRKWIKESVYPLFGRGPDVRARRMAKIAVYLAAADAAKGERKPRVSEAELLERANRHIDYVQSRIDGEEKPDPELLVTQARVLARLARPAAAAPALERALDLADQGRWTVDPARYAELEKELAKFDRKNAALRLARSRVASLTQTARALLADYVARGDASVLRSYTFASEMGAALGDDEGLLARAKELRLAARDRGLLSGTISALDSTPERWETILNSTPDDFSVAPRRVSLESVRVFATVDGDISVHDEYELRAKLVREGKHELGAAWGFVVAGPEQTDWMLAGIDDRGHVGIWTIARGAKGTSSSARSQTLRLEKPLDDDETPEIAVRVRADGRVTITIAGRPPVEARLALDPARPRRVGIFAKNGRTSLENAVVEQFP